MTATPQTNTEASPAEPETDAGTEPTKNTSGTDTAAEVAKWKELARKHEGQAKANFAAAQELETLRQQTMTDTEKAVAIARSESRTETLRELGGKLVAAEIRAAAVGRGVDVDALIEAVNPLRFLGDDLQPDRAAIVEWVDRVAPAQQGRGAFPDLGQGARGGGGQDMALNGDPLMRDIKTKLGMS